MGIVGVRCVKGDVSMEDHRTCMNTEYGPPCGMSPTILGAILRPKHDRDGVVFSPSSISSCHRQHFLQTGHDWFVDVANNYQMVRGDFVHEGLRNEPAPEGTLAVVRELRLQMPIATKYGEQVFSGQADEITFLRLDTLDTGERVLHVRLVDWKTKNDIPHDMLAADPRHVYQINEYALLVMSRLSEYMQGWIPERSTDACPPHSPYGKARYMLADGKEPIDFSEPMRVVVDELVIQYLSSNKTRVFHSEALMRAQGKMLGEKGTDGKWHAYRPRQYETLELEAIHFFSTDYITRHVRRGIEQQIDGSKSLAAPLVDDDARLMCQKCSVRQTCYDIGMAEGYDMSFQRPYVGEK